MYACSCINLKAQSKDEQQLQGIMNKWPTHNEHFKYSDRNFDSHEDFSPLVLLEIFQ